MKIDRRWGRRINIGARRGASDSMGKDARGRPATRQCRAPHLHFVQGMEVVDVSITRAGFGTELGPHSSKVVAGKRKKKKEGLPPHG
jgi:hypothetical protein